MCAETEESNPRAAGSWLVVGIVILFLSLWLLPILASKLYVPPPQPQQEIKLVTPPPKVDIHGPFGGGVHVR